MQYLYDLPVWREEIKILTADTLLVPGLEMFGHNCAAGNLRSLPHHIHATAEFLFLANGTQKYYIDDREYLLGGNQLLIVDADVPHSTGQMLFGRHESLWFRLDIIAFAGSLGLPESARAMICTALCGRKNPILPLGANMYGELKNAFYDLASEDPADRLCGYARFVAFITTLIKRTDPGTVYSAGIQRVVQFIADHICTHLSLEELAALAGLSLSGFKQKFRKETGISPREYINLAKIEKAKEYLAAGKTVTETAFALDFSSSSYFSVLFRQLENIPPSIYAARVRKTDQ